MTDAQIVAYIMLLNRQWLCQDGKLPDDTAILSKYAGHDMTSADMECVLARFPRCIDGGRANKRLYTIYLEQHSKHERRSQSAHVRWNADAKSDAKRHPMHMHTESGSVYSLLFSEFWKEWPDHKRKADKAGCERKWNDMKPEEQSAAMAGLAKWKTSNDWKKDNGQFIPAPKVWLNQRRWEAADFIDGAAGVYDYATDMVKA
jgi:uncharacterized protein YdaU (DUF1376 family)